MREQHARLNDEISLAYEEVGDPADPPLLLIHGLGAQMIAWRDEFLELLVDRGLRLIRFDNRDAGHSTHLAGEPDLAAIREGDRSSAVYTVEDMADDAAALLDQLGLESAHVAGVSMGGMIAQALAARHPRRVRSLTSIMSTTGERAASQPTPEAQAVLLGPPARTAEEAAQRAVEAARVNGSPGMVDEEWRRELARRSFERSNDPAAFARQLAAIWASRDRTEAVRTITAPTLVIHGAVDPLIPPSGGRATAAAIEGAELVLVDGMGHDLPQPLWPRIVDAIAAHVRRAEAARPTA